MENSFDMAEMNNQINIDAHYTDSMKIKKPIRRAVEAPNGLKAPVLFSDKEANEKLSKIDIDIYEGSKKERKKHDFNKMLYFKIFGGVVLATAGIAGISKIRKFFNKS